MSSHPNLNETVRKWGVVYRALKKNLGGATMTNVYNNFNKAFNNANNNSAHANANRARLYFLQNPTKRRYISAAFAKLPKSPVRSTPQNSSKIKNAVGRAVVHNALMTYVTAPSKLKSGDYSYRYKQLVKYLRNNPINIPVPLYRGVPKSTRYMPNKGYYNSGGRLISFAKNINTAKFFAHKTGTIYVLPPGKYPAFNINANVKRRYPNVSRLSNANKYNKLVQNYIGYAKAEDEILLAPGVYTVGNRRNSTNGNRIYKHIYFAG